MKLGIWLVRSKSEPLGEKLRHHLGGEVIKPWENSQESGKMYFQKQFTNYHRWILVMTTGIAVRYLDRLSRDKRTDPAVVVLDEGGRYAISLLSGHEGGANHLAYQVANIIGAIPVITTATETLKPLILGIGCRKGVSHKQIDRAVRKALEAIHRTPEEIREVATIDLKANEPGLLKWCGERRLPLRIIQQELLTKRPWVTKPSDWVRQNIGVEGVCEPCALLASVRGELILEKRALDGVTVAVVEDPTSIF